MSQTEIFNAAVRLSPDERTAFLERVCGANRELRAEIESLLQAHDAPDSFLREPVDRTFAYEPIAERAGTIIGPYKLLEQIGEGGMGTVWMSQQTEPVKRVVALKLIKAGMDSKQVIARFEAERQALALMDHANIARVLDAGATVAGRPYFVMDLVKGVPITKYCDEHHLAPRQRLELFIPVCQAVQHAHQKGIIHRDLKPSNVLVALYDGKPAPKVIDFGVAKAAGQQLTDKTLVTGFGAIVGTLEYMSPEQAEINQLDIDTRSDIYSLGVLLYELLAGTTPLEHKRVEESGMLEALRIIREEEAPTLSNRLAQTVDLPAIAANRGTEPAKLTGLVQGELNWIAMKSLEKDRSRRYQTATDFAMDLRRYLADEPVQAGPPSRWYRSRKLARKHQVALAMAALLATLLLSAVAILSISYMRITREQQVTKNALDGEMQANQELRRSLERERRLQNEVRLELVHRYWMAGAIELAQRALGECPPDLREAQWRRLHRLCHAEVQRINDTQVDAATWSNGRLFFSPDGKLLALCCADQPIRIWNATTGQALVSLSGQRDSIFTAAFTNHEQLVGIGFYTAPSEKPKSRRKLVEICAWDALSGKLKESWSYPAPLTVAAYVSPDGRRFATYSSKVLRINETTTGKQIRVCDLNEFNANKIAFSPNWRYFAASQEGAIGTASVSLRIWDTERGEVVSTFNDHPGFPWPMEFSADGTRLAYRLSKIGGSSEVRVCEVATGACLMDANFPITYTTIGISPDGHRLALAHENTVVIWDVATNQEVLTLRGHRGRVYSLLFSPDGERLATGSADGTIRFWDVRPIEDVPNRG